MGVWNYKEVPLVNYLFFESVAEIVDFQIFSVFNRMNTALSNAVDRISKNDFQVKQSSVETQKLVPHKWDLFSYTHPYVGDGFTESEIILYIS